MINKPEEVSTVPVGTNGVSAAICLSDMVIYLKAMQNGSPMLVGYMDVFMILLIQKIDIYGMRIEYTKREVLITSLFFY